MKLAALLGRDASCETQANVNAVAAAMGILIAFLVHDGPGAAIIGLARVDFANTLQMPFLMA